MDCELQYLNACIEGATEAELRIVDARLWQAIKAEDREHHNAIQPEDSGPSNILMAFESLVNGAIKLALERTA